MSIAFDIPADLQAGLKGISDLNSRPNWRPSVGSAIALKPEKSLRLP